MYTYKEETHVHTVYTGMMITRCTSIILLRPDSFHGPKWFNKKPSWWENFLLPYATCRFCNYIIYYMLIWIQKKHVPTENYLRYSVVVFYLDL